MEFLMHRLKAFKKLICISASILPVKEAMSEKLKNITCYPLKRIPTTSTTSANVYTSAVPLFYTSKLVGLVSNSAQSVDGVVTLRASRLGSAYTALVTGVVVTLVAVGWHLDRAFYDDASLVTQCAVTCLWWTTIITVVVVLCSSFKQADVVTWFEQMEYIDSTFENFNTKVPHKKNLISTLTFCLFFIILEYIIFIVEFHILPNTRVFESICLYLPHPVITLSECTFISCVAAVRQRLRLLNDYLQGPGRWANISRLRKLAELHDALHTASMTVDEHYKLQLLVILLLYFCRVVVLLYIVITQGLLEENPESASLLTFVFWYAVKILILCYICSSVGNEFSRTANILHNNLLTAYEPSIRTEMVQFSMRLHHSHMDFTAAGFVSINLTLAYSMAGMVTTYLLHLMQFYMTRARSNEP